MGKMIKKVLNLFLAFIMVLSAAGCSTRNKDYSEIDKIFKDNGYTFDVMYDCAYAYVSKDDQRWILRDGSKDLFYRDGSVDDGSGVVNLNNQKLYDIRDIKTELSEKDEEKRAKKYLESNEKELKKLDITIADVTLYLNKKWNQKQKEYSKLSNKERLEKEFKNEYIKEMSDSLINGVYKFYCKDRFHNFTYKELCENYINKRSSMEDLSNYHNKLISCNNSKIEISLAALLSSDDNMGVVYKLTQSGVTSDVDYIMLYDTNKEKVTSIACMADSTVEKSDFYLWSIIMMKLITDKDYTAQQWLSLLSNSVNNFITVDEWQFNLKMNDDYKLIALRNRG